MNKSQLVAEISKRTGVNLTKSQLYLDVTLAVIRDAVANKEVVQLVGFGSFNPGISVSRIVATPTGKKIQVPTKNTVKFKAGKNFKFEINRSAKKIKKIKSVLSSCKSKDF